MFLVCIKEIARKITAMFRPGFYGSIILRMGLCESENQPFRRRFREGPFGREIILVMLRGINDYRGIEGDNVARARSLQNLLNFSIFIDQK